MSATPGQAANEQPLSDYLRERGRPGVARMVEDAERAAVAAQQPRAADGKTAGEMAHAGDVLASLPRQWDAEADSMAHWGDDPNERSAYANALRDCASELRKTLAAPTPEQVPASEDAPVYTKTRITGTGLWLIDCDEGWRSSILCAQMYERDAEWLLSLLGRRPRRATPDPS